MTQIIRTKKATGVQLRQAAHHIRLIDTANLPFGFGNAYYAADPSPLQQQILRKGLQSVGVNHLKVTKAGTCVPTEPQDLFPDPVKQAMRTLMQETARLGGVDQRVAAAGRTLTASVATETPKTAKALARALVRGRGFKCVGPVWVKSVRLGRTSFSAIVEVDSRSVEVSVFKAD